VAAICHAPWLLVETDLVEGRKLTSYKSVRSDVVNAGGEWVDEAVVVDTDGAFTLITSRTPEDLNAFVTEIKNILSA
jgi:protease I